MRVDQTIEHHCFFAINLTTEGNTADLTLRIKQMRPWPTSIEIAEFGVSVREDRISFYKNRTLPNSLGELPPEIGDL